MATAERTEIERGARRLAFLPVTLLLTLAVIFTWEMVQDDPTEQILRGLTGTAVAGAVALNVFTIRQARRLLSAYERALAEADERALQLGEERLQVERRRSAQLAAARVLAAAGGLAEARDRMLEVVAPELGFEAARAWVPVGGVLRLFRSWARDPADAADLAREKPLEPGEELPARVWMTRVAEGGDAGPGAWRTALAFVVPDGGEVVAVIELLSRRIFPAQGLAEAAQDVGIQIGAFVERNRSRRAVAAAERRRARDLEEQVQARDQFLSIASHELKTPLTSLQLQLQSLARGAAGDPGRDERTAAKLAIALRSAERLGDLVNRLLDVSRIVTGDLDLVREELDLADVARQVAERFRAPLAESGSTLTLRTAPARGRWDHGRLSSIADSLLSNAVKYGEGRPIELGVEEAGDEARLWVRDRGIGIAPDDQARVFGRFERAVSQRHYGGFGLGLWVARLFAEAHGGRLRVESSLGQGSTFTLELPRGLGVPTPRPTPIGAPAQPPA
jgi:signal transduction histidine kinase